MAIKTVSLKTEAYERLKAARRYPGESFSEVILRARWPEDTITGEELLGRYRDRGAWFTETELSAIEAAKAADGGSRSRNSRHFERVPGLEVIGYS